MFILRKLGEGPQTGYSIRKEFERSTGHRLSFGSIYPLLDKLTEEKLITVAADGRKKVYSLTATGKERAHLMREERSRIIDDMIGRSRMMCEITGADPEQMVVLLEQLKRGEDPLLPIRRGVMVAHRLLLDMARDGRLRKHSKEVNAILTDANKRLERLK